jgi:hypothetical protein
MSLAEYLKMKQLEHCNKVGHIVTEADWVKNVLNSKLSEGDKLSYASVNQWMNGDRSPDAKNVMRLIRVFGPEVMPYIGIKLAPDLANLMRDWDRLSDEGRKGIMDIYRKENPGVYLQV